MPPKNKKLDGAYFARLALDYFDHPKIAKLSPAAICTHLEMILYSRRYLTDGRIPKRIANRIASGFASDSSESLSESLTQSLSESLTQSLSESLANPLAELATNDPDAPSIAILDDGSVILYGYADAQETKEEIEVKRQVNARNGAKNKRVAKRNETQSLTQSLSDSLTQSLSESPNRGREEESTHSSSVSRRRARETPLPDNWQPNDKHRAKALELSVNIDLESQSFRAYAEAHDRRCVRWDAAFNQWLLKAKPVPANKLQTLNPGGRRLEEWELRG